MADWRLCVRRCVEVEGDVCLRGGERVRVLLIVVEAVDVDVDVDVIVAAEVVDVELVRRRGGCCCVV